MSNSDTPLQRRARRIDHIAIAVPNLDKALVHYCDLLGFELLERRATEGARTGMVSAVLRVGDVTVVLVQGTSPDSQVSRFVDARGAGVQHVAIEVDNLAGIYAELAESGVGFVTSEIQGDGIRQAFTARDPESGMMYEFIERQRPDGHFTDDSVRELFRQMEEADAY